MNLQKIRGHIDEVDREILGLLNERMELALRTAKLKGSILDEEREAQVLDQVTRYSRSHNHLVRDDLIKLLFGEIMKESRRIQEAI